MGEKAILYKLYTSSTHNTFLLCLLNRISPPAYRRGLVRISSFHRILRHLKKPTGSSWACPSVQGYSLSTRQNNPPARSASCNPPPSRRIRTYLCCFDSAPDPLQASAGISPRFSLSAFNLICPPLGTSIPNWYINYISFWYIA